MSKLIGDLLGVKSAEFHKYIEKLEHASLRPGVDIRLSAEISAKTRSKVSELGLDAADTTAKELFYALRAKLKVADNSLIKKLNLENSDQESTADVIAQSVSGLSRGERSLSLTLSGIRKILKAVPPKRTMKTLKYRSIDSVLKRDDPRLLYLLACRIEGKSWQSQVHAKMRRLDSKDITWQEIECVSLPIKWYEKAITYLSGEGVITVNPEAGVVCVLPVIVEIKPGMTTLALTLVLQAMQRLAEQSLPYKKYAMTRGYAEALPEIAHGVKVKINSIHGLRPSWAIVRELVRRGHVAPTTLDIDFELGEMSWRTVEMKLIGLCPEFNFWIDTHFLGLVSSDTNTSLHIVDVATTLVSDDDYGSQSNQHFEGSLWNELQIRYLQEDSLNHSLVNQLIKS